MKPSKPSLADLARVLEEQRTPVSAGVLAQAAQAQPPRPAA